MSAGTLLITGMRGTVAPYLAKSAQAGGWKVVAWPRDQFASDSQEAIATGLGWVQSEGVTAIAHLGFGPELFSAQLAGWCAKRSTPFLFTSTAMVFHHEPDGPHAPSDLRNAHDDYGKYKIRCEDAVWQANPSAIIARLGWQIGANEAGDAAGNNMLAALDREFAQTGKIRASAAWRPACSFLSDTGAALFRLIQSEPLSGGPTARHIDSNAQSAMTFAQIVQALGDRFKRPWANESLIERHAEYVHDQRLSGGEQLMPPLKQRLAP